MFFWVVTALLSLGVHKVRRRSKALLQTQKRNLIVTALLSLSVHKVRRRAKVFNNQKSYFKLYFKKIFLTNLEVMHYGKNYWY